MRATGSMGPWPGRIGFVLMGHGLPGRASSLKCRKDTSCRNNRAAISPFSWPIQFQITNLEPNPTATTPPLPDIPQVEIAIVEMTNAFRRENKLGEVKINANLSKAARDYAAYLARTNIVLAHR